MNSRRVPASGAGGRGRKADGGRGLEEGRGMEVKKVGSEGEEGGREERGRGREGEGGGQRADVRAGGGGKEREGLRLSYLW